MAQHTRLEIDAGIWVCFCNPQNPWQRGTNENTNGLLRQNFPRGPISACPAPTRLLLLPRPLTPDRPGPSAGTHSRRSLTHTSNPLTTAMFRGPIESAKYKRPFTGHDGRQRHSLLHEPVRQCLGQCGDRMLLLVVEHRRTERTIYRTRNEAKADVSDYIERFYSAVRRHLMIGYLSQVEFERKVGLAQLDRHQPR